MKNLIIALVSVVAFSFASCKKDYTCSCTNVPVIGNYSFTIPDSKEGDAEDACDAYEAAAPGSSCTLD